MGATRVPGSGGSLQARSPEELRRLQVEATAALVLSLIQKGVIRLETGPKEEAGPT